MYPPDAMTASANHNNPPLRNRIRLGCPEVFPSLSAQRPVFVTGNPRLTVEIVAADGRYRPPMVLLGALDAGVLAGLAGRPILSCLVTEAFDAMDLASTLQAAGFDGRYIALAPEVPDRALIRREVKTRAPGVLFDVFPVTCTPFFD